MRCDILDFSDYENGADGRSDRLLQQALEGCGVGTRIIGLTRKGPELPLSEWVWLRYDLRNAEDLRFVSGVATALTRSGHAVFPPALAIRLSEDKWASYLTLRGARIPTVETSNVKTVFPNSGFLVRKPRVGWGGRGITLFQPEAAGGSEVDGGEYVWQPFVAHSHTLTAVAGEDGANRGVLLKKRAKPGDFRTNSTYGEEAEYVGDGGEPIALAQRTLDAFGLAVGTVDLLEEDGNMVVLEVNSAPCLWYDEIPGLDLAGPMARRVAAWFLRMAGCT